MENPRLNIRSADQAPPASVQIYSLHQGQAQGSSSPQPGCPGGERCTSQTAKPSLRWVIRLVFSPRRWASRPCSCEFIRRSHAADHLSPRRWALQWEGDFQSPSSCPLGAFPAVETALQLRSRPAPAGFQPTQVGFAIGGRLPVAVQCGGEQVRHCHGYHPPADQLSGCGLGD